MTETQIAKDAMNDAKFVLWRQKRRALTLMLDTSEAAIWGICVLWGFQLAIYHTAYGIEPIAAALREFVPGLPLAFHGCGLMVVGAIHLIGVVADARWVRRKSILAQIGFMCFAWTALVLVHKFYVAGVYTLPWLLALSWWNYFALKEWSGPIPGATNADTERHVGGDSGGDRRGGSPAGDDASEPARGVGNPQN